MQKMSEIDQHFIKCNVFKIRSTVYLVPTSGLQPDLKKLGPFSGTEGWSPRALVVLSVVATSSSYTTSSSTPHSSLKQLYK